LNMPTSMTDPDKRKKFVSEFVETYRASKGRVMVVQGGVTASTMNLPAVDARVLDVERITKNRVATVYNIPPHMLGDYSDTSYSTAEQSMLEFLQLTILPILTQWENELNRKLLTWEMIADGYAFRFDMDALTRPDAATMAEKNQKALRGGWQTINETRAMDGKPPVSGGDTPLIARDLLPLERVLNGETISAGGSAGKGERNNRE
ncbi:MAG: phage portal protein, partial [Clostridia bacterium]